MDKYICELCDWVYDPAKGVPHENIAPGTPFSALPDSFFCPLCGADKSAFSRVEG